jgi:POTRA domain, FtsQ-type
MVERTRAGSRRAPARGRLHIPHLRWIALGAGLAALAVGAYAVARETSIFAVRTIDIAGGSPRAKREVRRALAPELGRSLITISGAEIDRRVARLPDVVSAIFDRSFPSTLHVRIRAERAVLLLRQGSSSWVVSSLGRVMRRVAKPTKSSLPRLWLPKSVHVAVGETLPRYEGKLAAAAVAPIAPGVFHGGVRNVASSPDELTLVLAAGPQIRLGDIGDLHLKLAIARRILHIAAESDSSTPAAYVDVSVPGRPVLGSGDSQLASTG